MDLDPDPGATQIMSQLLLLVVLTLINAYFAGAEMAVVSVNKNKIRKLSEEGSQKAAMVQSLFDDSTRFLSTIQVAITLANFFSSASAASGISVALGGWMLRAGIPYSETIAMVFVTVVLSFLTLIFGELVPKRIALQKAEAFSMWTVKPIYYISKVMSPFIRLLSASTNLVLRIAGMKTGNIEEKITEEEIRGLLKSGREQGVFNEIEQDMITSVFSFDDKTAREIMVPRKDVFAIDILEPLPEYLDEMLECRYTKIPVYREERDNIVGVLDMRDFAIEARKVSFENVEIEKLMQKPYFVPETKNADSLFRELQSRKNHIAVLIDEYGGFSGIVTVEDLVEEVMGEIYNEYDQEDPQMLQVSDTTYIIDGGILVDELNEKLNLKLETENSDTVSGYIIEQLGYIPEEDEHPEVQVGDIRLKVEKMNHKAIHRILLAFGS